MRIAHLSAEVSPFAKTGGLGDVLGALPKAQAKLGDDVTVWMPLYRQVWETLSRLGQFPEKATEPFDVLVGGTHFHVGVLRTHLPHNGVPVYLIGQDECFDRPQLYSPDYFGRDDGVTRYTVFVRAVLGAMQRMWLTPDVLHAHDWHTVLGTMALAWDQPKNWVFNQTATVLTIHNMAYQGVYDPSLFPLLGLPPAVAPLVEHHGALNLMKGGLLAADEITAVSPTFAKEIMTPTGGFGLDPIVRSRAADVAGIVNGIDHEVWDPAIDKRIPFHYDIVRVGAKRQNRRALLEHVGMDPEDEGLLLGLVGRLVPQKGYELFFPIVDELLDAGIRVIFLGSGEPHLEKSIHFYSNNRVGRFWGYVGFREELVHLIEAGSDAFVMPSLFEPCGLNQLYSLRYGTPPIVRRVGGLADTVIPYDGTNRNAATGFGFDEASSEALRDAIFLAQKCHADQQLWTQLATNAMRQDYSWEASAQKYADLYARVLKKKRG